MSNPAFAPNPRGSLSAALGKPGQLSRIAPASPRPVELLGSLTVNGGTTMTADDAALHELLVAAAYENDRRMTGETASIPMSYVLRYLGSDTRREHVRASLNRLRQTTVSFRHDDVRYEDVPLLVTWLRTTEDTDEIVYQLPEPVRLAMSDRARYAYVELAAFPRMVSTYSSRLYRRLVAAIAGSGKRWQIDGDNLVVVEATPEDVADWVSFPRGRDGSLHVGKLRERVLAGLQRDFSAVTSFSFAMTTLVGSGRGRPLERILFKMELAAPTRFQMKMRYEADALQYVGGTDTSELAVESAIWVKAGKHFYRPGQKVLSYKDWWELWLAALHEMERGIYLSRGRDERVYRGESLRQKIKEMGASEAAWRFCEEEAREPDLSLQDIIALRKVGRDAREARLRPVTDESVSPISAAVHPGEPTEVRLRLSPTLTEPETDEFWRRLLDRAWSHDAEDATRRKLVIEFMTDGKPDYYEQINRMIEADVASVLDDLDQYLEVDREYAA